MADPPEAAPWGSQSRLAGHEIRAKCELPPMGPDAAAHDQGDVMAKADRKRPTDGELEILSVLWELGPCTVREVFHELSKTRSTGYTTVLKLMQIMTEKGLVTRDTGVRPQVYRVARSQKQMQRQLLGDLLDRAFSGSPGNLVMQALSTRKASPEELKQIREMLDELEGDDT